MTDGQLLDVIEGLVYVYEHSGRPMDEAGVYLTAEQARHLATLARMGMVNALRAEERN
jgi:hypothetical protein